ncbi:hypothetical protein [Paenibacillus sp. V4I5]|uniref:hypothetical protein n=1 Tax=Paenibacillus sp. V4I5 TaxID=3042306 RepID=UPI002792F324|nr:hypothetical protein [Paenibacillus sp. V4I5]MDQ0913847.1 hypothetical protein [Paenibacillus sp. V4I5]
MKKFAGLLLSIFSISILMIVCNGNNPKTLSLEHEQIKFISISNNQGYNKTLEDSNQILIVLNAIEKAEKLEEVLNPTTPNRTPDEDYILGVHYDSAVKHDALNSVFVWFDKEKNEVKIAPIQKGTTNIYKLTSESAQEIKKLI